MSIQVKARQKGFYGDVLRYPGDVFSLAPGAKPGKWMDVVKESDEPADEAEKPAKVSKKKGKESDEPTTFSEIAKADGAAQGQGNNNAV